MRAELPAFLARKITHRSIPRPVSSIYQPNKSNEAEKVFGADDKAHPAVTYLHSSVKDFYVGGSVQAVNAPEHYDYVELRCKSDCSLVRSIHC